MKTRHALLWSVGLLVLYVLSSGPALLLRRTAAWDTLNLDVVYWPVSRLILTPASQTFCLIGTCGSLSWKLSM